VGREECRRALGQTGGLFLRGVRLHESLPIYSGGLGILAGDHIKASSDLGIPLVGVGLYYDQGYFKQRLDRDGWQHEDYIHVDHRVLPIRPANRRPPVIVSIETRPARSSRASGRSPSDATRCSARLGRRRQPARGSRS
jgi:glucan phosphorylase